jgi:Flp pilus assembly protein protease CpaA
MYEVIFLLVAVGVWVLAASIRDLQVREVPNWLSFSLIIFALGFRFFYSLFSGAEWVFFYQGLIGLGIFFVLGNAFYYGRVFAGGDAKLLIALGSVLGLTSSFSLNWKYYFLFVLLVLFIGSIYGIIWSVFLSVKNFSKFRRKVGEVFYKNKKMFYLMMIPGVLSLMLGFLESYFLILGILFLIFPLLYVYAKSVDDVSMIKKIKVDKLTEGDWLVGDVRVGKGKVKQSWEGLSKKDIELIRKYHKSVEIRQGIPFVPVFLISFIIFVWVYYSGFLNGFCWLG